MKPSHMGVKGGYLTRFSDSRIIRLLKVHDLYKRQWPEPRYPATLTTPKAREEGES
jgi:hypothetical protein